MKAIVKMSCSACNYDMPSIDCEVCAGEIEYTEVVDVEPINVEPQLNKMFDAFNAQYGIETKPLDHNLDGMHEIVGGEYLEWAEEIDISIVRDTGSCITDKAIPNPENFVKEGLDVIYAMTQQLRERGVDIDAGLAEVHRSNMSKTVDFHDLKDELNEARKRYPDAVLIPLDNGRYVMKSPSQGKVIKPACYSSAVITEAIIKQK